MTSLEVLPAMEPPLELYPGEASETADLILRPYQALGALAVSREKAKVNNLYDLPAMEKIEALQKMGCRL